MFQKAKNFQTSKIPPYEYFEDYGSRRFGRSRLILTLTCQLHDSGKIWKFRDFEFDFFVTKL